MTKAEADVIFKDEIAVLEKSLAIQSTGNYEQDMAHIHDSARSTCMMAAGFCPNGDGGKLDTTVPGQAKCPVCGFIQFRSTLGGL